MIPPAFSDQLNAFGHSAVEQSDWKVVQPAFASASDFDFEDAFAHHYLAFSLDIEGVEPRRVESEYRLALELERRHALWHARSGPLRQS